MPITTVSIRLAITKIAEITCGTRPKLISVRALGDVEHRIYYVSIPFEYKVEVCSYLTEHLHLRKQPGIDPLLLTGGQAAALIHHVLTMPVPQWAE